MIKLNNGINSNNSFCKRFLKRKYNYKFISTGVRHNMLSKSSRRILRIRLIRML